MQGRRMPSRPVRLGAVLLALNAAILAGALALPSAGGAQQAVRGFMAWCGLG